MTIVSWEFESPSLHKNKCGNSSVGRARPCQGRGREFEPRFPLSVRMNDYSSFFCFMDCFVFAVCKVGRN